MERLKYIEPEDANALTRKLFRQIGMVPNLYAQMANSTMVFECFVRMTGTLDAANLDKKLREMVYLRTSEINGCEYCLGSHTTTATESGLMTMEETLDARRGKSADPKIDALLHFASEVVLNRGDVSDETLEAVREQGFGDEDIVDCLGTVALATLTNYIAKVGRPDMDYLDADPLEG